MNGVNEVFLQYGAIGAFVIILLAVVAVLYRENRQLQLDKLALVNDKIALVEARRTDAVENTTKIMTVLQENSQNNAVLAAKIRVGKITSNGSDE